MSAPGASAARDESMPRYQRILLKLSGEVMAGEGSFGLDAARVKALAEEVAAVAKAGVQIGLVVGGGNFFRGVAAAARHMDRVAADHMGMLATVINALALQDALEQQGVPTRVMTAITMNEVAEPYIRRRAIRHMEKGRVVIFAAGTGNPFFTTDTAAALRAAEMGCGAMLKGTQVDGVYSADPKQVKDAVRYDSLSYHEVLSRDLQVMDASAISLSRENKIPIIVFSIHDSGALAAVLRGQGRSTIIHEGA